VTIVYFGLTGLEAGLKVLLIGIVINTIHNKTNSWSPQACWSGLKVQPQTPLLV